MPTYCGFLPAEGEHKSDEQDIVDEEVESSGMLKTVDALNPAKNKFTKENLKKFLSEFDYTHMDRSKPKGLAHLIIDDVAKFFKLGNDDLKNARKEAEEHVNLVCKEPEPQKYARCDNLSWLDNLATHDTAMPAFSNIAKAMAKFGPKLNAKS